MKEALGALTNRGRAFLAGGLAALLCAVVLGYPALVRVGILVAALPVVAALLVSRGRYRLGLTRTVDSPLVAAGQQARVRLELTNDGTLPTGVLLLEEQLPYALGTRPRFVVHRMGAGWKREVDYSVRSEVRGRFTLGPMTVRVSDPFGLVDLERAFTSTSALVVTPRVTALPAIPLTGSWTGAGDNRPRSFATGSAEDVTVREYRLGDDLRRVHWRSSAKVGELMVRREEQPWQSRATVFLDNRAGVHRGAGATSSLEHAVAVAASIGAHLAQRGFEVRLVTAGGEEHGGAWHDHGARSAAPLLEELAVLDMSPHSHLDVRWADDTGRSGLLVAVLGEVTRHDQAALTRIRHSAATALAFALDVGAWEGGAAGGGTGVTALLGSLGFRNVVSRPQDAVVALWQELGHSRAGRSPARSSA